MVRQYGSRRIAQVLGGDDIQQIHRHRALVGGRITKELLDLTPVTPATDHDIGCFQRVDT